MYQQSEYSRKKYPYGNHLKFPSPPKPKIFYVVRYSNERSGMIFGIVRDEDIFRKWNEFFDVPVEIDKVYKIKLANEYKHDARVLFKGSYKECSEKFTEFNDQYRKSKH